MIEVIYINALLSDAAYIDFNEGDIDPNTGEINPDGNIDVVNRFVSEPPEGRGWTIEQYEWFQNNFVVYKSANGDLAHQQNTDTGFAATMFQYTGPDLTDAQDVKSGAVFFAARGTEPSAGNADIIYDVLLAAGDEVSPFFIGSSQIPDLESFVNQNFFNNNGVLASELDSNVHFTGHSLGGHLSLVASAYESVRSSFANLNTFNAAGLSPISPLWRNLVSPLVASGYYNSSNTGVYIAEQGLEVTSNDFTFRRAGPDSLLFIDDFDSIDNAWIETHLMEHIVNSLSAYRVLASLDYQLDSPNGLGTIQTIFHSLTRFKTGNIDELLSDFRQVFGLSGVEASSWESLYQLLDTKAVFLNNDFTISSLIEYSTEELISQARTDRAIAYALENNLSFVIRSTSELPVYGQEQYDYSQQSDAYIRDRAVFLIATLSSNYDNTLSGDTSEADVAYIHDLETGEAVYRDLPSNIDWELDTSSLPNVIFGNDSGNDSIAGTTYDDRLYGRGGNDTINGGEGNDYIEGGDGIDLLEGGQGFDTLVGGSGFDTYWFDENSGSDIIRDSDDLGELIYNGLTLTGGTQHREGSNTYISEEDGVRYLLQGTSLLVAIEGAPGVHTIENFESGDLGITLTDYIAEDPDSVSRDDYLLDDFAHAVVDENGNIIAYSDYASPDRTINYIIRANFDVPITISGWSGSDAIWGNAVGDTLRGGYGNDEIYGNGGDDNLYGGVGNDFLYGHSGADDLSDDYLSLYDPNDILGPTTLHPDDVDFASWSQELSGEDTDYLYGGEGNDTIVTNHGTDHVYAGADNDTVYTGFGADIIDGGSGDDTIFADLIRYSHWVDDGDGSYSLNYILSDAGEFGGNDIIDGGAGTDTINGGYGDDTITGGSGNDNLQGDGNPGDLTQLVDGTHQGNDTIFGGLGDDNILGVGGDDVLYGNEGHDTIFGDQQSLPNGESNPESNHGDDIIYGGSGNDTVSADGGNDRVYGDSGNDTVLGGKGDDQIYGGSGDDELQGQAGQDYIDGGDGQDKLFGFEGDDEIYGGDGDDELIGATGSDQLNGGLGDDGLWGGEGNDFLFGNAGSDDLSGGAGDDTLVGGAGRDALGGTVGDEGNDTYVFNVGDGADGLLDEAGSNTLRFGVGISSSDISLSQESGTYFVDYSDGSDYIQLDGNSFDYIQRFEFADGSSMSTIELLERENPEPVSDSTLNIDSSINTNELQYTQINNNLVISYTGSIDNWLTSFAENAHYFETTTDEILQDIPEADLVAGLQAFVLINWFASDIENNINEISNGTETISLIDSIEYDSINSGTEHADYIEGTNLADTISSYEGNDYIESGFGDDVIDAGEGADFIEDDGGDDSYVFNQGDGKDVIFDTSGNDALSFGQGISVSDFTVTESVSGLLIQIGDVNDPNHDSLLLREWGWNLDSRIDSFVFSDGTSLTSGDIESMITGNHAPDFNDPIEQQTAERDQPFSFTIPENTFVDTEDETTLDYTVTLADGSDLPSWITYDEATRTFSGTPAIEDSGTWEFRIMVQDSQGLFNFHNFNIEVPTPEGAITGTVYDDILEGDENDNYIFGLSGDDIIRGNEGNDELFGSYGEDELYGGRGNDTLHGNLDDDELFGAEGNDSLHGNLGDDELRGGEGNDELHGGGGDDRLYAGSGDDQLYGGEGNDYLASFDDSDWSEGGSDLFDGGIGNDEYNVSDNSTIFLEVGDGDDYIYTDGSLNLSFGSGVTFDSLEFDTFINTDDSSNPSIDISYTEHDSFSISPFYDGTTIFNFQFHDGSFYSLTPEEIQELSQLATDGDDGISGDSYLLGLDGDDHITTSGQTIIDAGAGDDSIGSNGSFGYILLRAGDGNDSLIGINRSYPYPTEIAYMGSGDDYVLAYDGDDIIYGEGGNDLLYGDAGDDLIEGGLNNDVIYGGEGNDILIAGDGHDQIYDALGDNTLRGGAGDDTYRGLGFYDDYFDGLVYSNSVNRILDTSGNDTLELMRTDEDYDSIASVRRAGNDLVIEASHDSENTSRAYIIQNWFISTDYHIETINVSDGSGGVTSLSPLDIEGMLENDGELTIVPDSNAYIFSTSSDSATLQRVNNDLIIEFPDPNNNLTIEDWFNDQSDITEFRFSDGQVWYAEDINFDLSTLNGTSGDDHIESGSRRDVINTYEGNDIINDMGGDNVINSGAGNDNIFTAGGRNIIDAGAGDDRVVSGGGSIITGGLGNDALVGGMGHELYHYNLGDGNDVIEDLDGSVIFGEGISLSDLSFSVNTDSGEVITTIGNDEGQIIFRRGMPDSNFELPPPLIPSSELPPPPVADVPHFGGLSLGMELIFNDGTRTTLLNLLATQGTESSDTLSGTSETDVLLGYGGNDTINGLEDADYIFGGSGSDTIYGNDGFDFIEGDDGDDYLYGGQGDDFINGGTGSDSIYGGLGNDELNGFFGNDFLQGGAGNDTYYFYRGQGNDTIDNYDQNSNSIDVLRIDPSITSDQLSFEQVADNLVLTLPDGETLTILNHFLGGENSEHAIDLIEFFDGTVIERADIESLVPVTGTDADDDIEGTNANDTIGGAGGGDKLRGFDGDDNLFGGVGDDKIYGDDGSDILDGGDGRDFLTAGRGNDQLYGGLGDDRLSGSYGSDIFYYNLGDGSDWVQNSQVDPSDIDTISLGDGIGLEDIVLSRSSENLVIEFNDGGQITVQWQFKEPTSSGTVYSIDRIEFSDGSVLEQADIDSYFTTATNNDDELHGDSTANSIDGLDGNDSIYGYSGEDLLAGGAGNDNIRAGDDNDIIYGNDGNDSLYGENGDDIIHGGLGNDHMSGGNGSDTYHFARGEGDDSISNSDYSETSIDTIQLATGILPEDVSFSANSAHLVITLDTGEKLTIYSHFSEDRYAIDVIEFDNGEVVTKEDIKLLFSQETEESDSIFGDNTVNDVINGLGGSDRIYGLDGDDYLDGGDGNDLMYGGGGSDILIGNNGRDNLNAGSGADELTGGQGDDILFGNNGDDIYYYSAGDGNDTIFDQEHSAGGLDVISFDNTITLNDISFEQNGSDLLLNLSSGEVITIQRYYDNEFWRIERLEFSDGTFLSLDSVDSLASTTSEKTTTEPVFIEPGQMNLQQNNQFYVTEPDRGPTWRRLLSEHEITEMTTGMIESFILGEKKNNAMSIPNKDPSGMFVNDNESGFNIKNNQDRMVPDKHPEGMFVDEQSSTKNYELRMVPNKTPEGMFLDNETLVGGFSQNELSQTLEGAKFFDLLLQQSSFGSNEEKLTEASNVEHYEESQPVIAIPYL